MSVLHRSNDALDVNPPVGNRHLSLSGSDWLWAVCAVYCVLLLAVVGLAYFARQGEKIFHYLFTISLFTGAVAYFTMASDLGSVAIHISDNLSHGGTREIFYARYINWFVGWTPLVIALGLISGVSWATIVYNVALSWVWVCTWLSGAVTGTTYKWGFFVFGVFAYFLLAASILGSGLVTAKRLEIQRHYLPLAGWTVFLWFLYPIAWGLDDGGNEIKVTSGFIFFGILDVLLIPVVGFGFLLLSNKWDYRKLNIYFTQYGRVAQGGEFPEREKTAPLNTAPAPAVTEPEQTV